MCPIPEILYKYRPITEDDRLNINNSFTRNIIERGELYFSRFSELNDPNEAIFDYPTDIDIAIDKNELKEYSVFSEKEQLSDGRFRLRVDGRIGAMHVRKRVDKMYGLFCLTEDPKNLLMYDYYASGHKGICIGFDWKKLGLVYKGNKQYQIPRKLKYLSKPPLIKPIGDVNFSDAIFTKWKEYKHEKELRLIYTPGIYNSSNNVLSAIKEIIFGCAVPMCDREMVTDWVRYPLRVNFYEVYLRARDYRLNIRAV